MGYIKFVLSKRKANADGTPAVAVVGRITSDMAHAGTLETNLIMHALSAQGGRVVEELELRLDIGRMDTNRLG